MVLLSHSGEAGENPALSRNCENINNVFSQIARGLKRTFVTSEEKKQGSHVGPAFFVAWPTWQFEFSKR
jgi:hypothetical protein